MTPDPDALLKHAESLLDERQLRPALRAFDEAERLGACADRCAAGRWMTWMLLGALEKAWRESDSIRLRGAPDPYRFWNGEDLRGKNVVLRCLHGFGDAVQMLRFVPQLAGRCDALIVEVPPRLLELAPYFDGVGTVITWGALAPPLAPVWDVQVEIMELPYLLRATEDDLPLATRYLKLPSAARQKASTVMGPRRKPRVGLVWAAGDWNPTRTLPLKHVTRIIAKADCEFWNLQGGKEQAQWKALGLTANHRDAAECGNGILTLAAVIEQLDLVITVDTLAAHLAGTLGTPAWVMLQYAADWRWMSDRNDSPWYPSLKLYRQHSPGNWESTIADLERDLIHWLEHTRRLDLAG